MIFLKNFENFVSIENQFLNDLMMTVMNLKNHPNNQWGAISNTHSTFVFHIQKPNSTWTLLLPKAPIVQLILKN
jgi:hypothetical protein